MNIAAQIKNLRLSKGITQKELAEQTGIALQSIINYENGRREPNSKAMAALERYFKVSGEFLRGETDERLQPAVWEDKEVMDAVKDTMSILFDSLQKEIRESPDEYQKQYFDMLEMLRHILRVSKKNESNEPITLAHGLLVETVRFIDSH